MAFALQPSACNATTAAWASLDLVVGREAAHEPQGHGFLREHALDRLAGRAPAKARVADAGDLVGFEAGVLGLEVHDEPPHCGRKPAAASRLRTEEAVHALRLEAGRPAPQRATGGRACLVRPPVRRAAEQDQGADELVVPLLGPPAKELDLLPLVGRLD